MILTAIFIGVAFYVYNYYIAPRLNPDFVPNREFTYLEKEKEESKIVKLYLFSVDWCPFSKKIKPVWKKFKQTFQNKKINQSVIKLEEIDGDENSKKMENFENKFLNGKKIEGYPSIYLVKNNQVIEFEAKPSIETLTEFVNTVL